MLTIIIVSFIRSYIVTIYHIRNVSQEMQKYHLIIILFFINISDLFSINIPSNKIEEARNNLATAVIDIAIRQNFRSLAQKDFSEESLSDSFTGKSNFCAAALVQGESIYYLTYQCIPVELKRRSQDELKIPFCISSSNDIAVFFNGGTFKGINGPVKQMFSSHFQNLFSIPAMCGVIHSPTEGRETDAEQRLLYALEQHSTREYFLQKLSASRMPPILVIFSWMNACKYCFQSMGGFLAREGLETNPDMFYGVRQIDFSYPFEYQSESFNSLVISRHLSALPIYIQESHLKRNHFAKKQIIQIMIDTTCQMLMEKRLNPKALTQLLLNLFKGLATIEPDMLIAFIYNIQEAHLWKNLLQTNDFLSFFIELIKSKTAENKLPIASLKLVAWLLTNENILQQMAQNPGFNELFVPSIDNEILSSINVDLISHYLASINSQFYGGKISLHHKFVKLLFAKRYNDVLPRFLETISGFETLLATYMNHSFAKNISSAFVNWLLENYRVSSKLLNIPEVRAFLIEYINASSDKQIVLNTIFEVLNATLDLSTTKNFITDILSGINNLTTRNIDQNLKNKPAIISNLRRIGINIHNPNK